MIDQSLWEQAHRYILFNTPGVESYVEEHIRSLKTDMRNKGRKAKWIQDEHNRKFIFWFREQILKELNMLGNDVSETLRWIAPGPLFEVTKYSAYEIKGVRYNIKDKDNCSVTQNSGVSLVSKIMQYASAKDNNPIEGEMTFYGVIKEIWDVNYAKFCIPLFKCDWIDSKSGVKRDDLGFTCVDLNKLGHKSDPFILASQAKQVFYVEDPLDPRWHVVLCAPQHDEIDDGPMEEDDPLSHTTLIHDHFTPNVPDLIEEIDIIDDDEDVHRRDDCEGIWIDT